MSVRKMPAVMGSALLVFWGLQSAWMPVGSAATSERRPSDCTVTGTSGDDDLRGTDGPDVICGLAGNDRIRALRGNDVVFGGAGVDDIFTFEGRDRIFGGRAHDDIFAGAGADRV
jgi:Ca2+-binding RTX toxin-like protein